MSILSDWYWPDRRRVFAEMRRVARQRILVLTFDRSVAEQFWLSAEYLPRAHELWDSFSQTLADFGPCEVLDVPVPADCIDWFFHAFWRRPHAYLEDSLRWTMAVFNSLDQQKPKPASHASRTTSPQATGSPATMTSSSSTHSTSDTDCSFTTSRRPHGTRLFMSSLWEHGGSRFLSDLPAFVRIRQVQLPRLRSPNVARGAEAGSSPRKRRMGVEPATSSLASLRSSTQRAGARKTSGSGAIQSARPQRGAGQRGVSSVRRGTRKGHDAIPVARRSAGAFLHARAEWGLALSAIGDIRS
jgi:hypothetical protein